MNRSHKNKQNQPDSSLPDHEEVTVLQQQIGELTEALQRERADVSNIRRRHAEDMANLRTSAVADVVEQLLPVIDNFERSLKYVPEDLADNQYVKGVGGLIKQFQSTLSAMGVQKIPTVGHGFDPNLHEAVSMEEGQGKHEVVTEELQSGYSMGDKIIRHAMVRVGHSDLAPSDATTPAK